MNQTNPLFSSLAFHDKIALIVASGLGSGYSPLVSGTAGTLLAVPISLVLSPLWSPHLSISGFLMILIISGIGVWSSSRAEVFYGKKDDGRVVIDEISGYFLSIYGLPKSWFVILSAFILFRIFDILKPFPARQSQKLHAGWGIMIDDLIAALYTNLLLRLCLFWWS